MLYLLYGADSFSAEEALKEIKAGLGDQEMLSANTTVLEGAAATAEAIAAACETVPFLADHRLIVVKRLLARGEPPVGGRGSRVASGKGTTSPSPRELAAAIKELAGRMPPMNVLVLLDGELTPANSMLPVLAPLGQAREFRRLKGRDLQRWIKERAGRIRAHIAPVAVELMADLTGGDLWSLSSDLEKLSLYCQGRAITEEDVHLLVSEAREANVFAMIDAIFEGRSSQALRLLYRLTADGMTAPQLLALLNRQLRMIVLASDLLQQGIPPDEVRTRAGIPAGFVAQKIMGQLRGRRREQLEMSYRRLLEADVSIKTGRLREDAAMDLLVAELSRST